MSFVRKIRHELNDLGFRDNLQNEIETLGVQLTICQLIVVVLSIISVVFLFVPFLFLTDVKFMLIFMSVSLVSLGLGVWFWVKRAQICENPEEIQEQLQG